MFQIIPNNILKKESDFFFRKVSEPRCCTGHEGKHPGVDTRGFCYLLKRWLSIKDFSHFIRNFTPLKGFLDEVDPLEQNALLSNHISRVT